jgi:hypothetical protein
MVKDRSSGEKPPKSKAGERGPQSASTDANEPQMTDHGDEPAISIGLPSWVVAGGLPLSDAIKVFATDNDKRAAEEFDAARKVHRDESNQKHLEKEKRLDAEIQCLFGDTVADPNFGREVALHKLKQIADGDGSGDTARGKAREFLRRKDELHAEHSRRRLQEPDDIEAEYDKLNSILANSLLAKLKSRQRIAVGRVNDVEHWSAIPASEWNDEWIFFDRSNCASRDSPRTTIKGIRILRPEDLTANDKSDSSTEKKPAWSWSTSPRGLADLNEALCRNNCRLGA